MEQARADKLADIENRGTGEQPRPPFLEAVTILTTRTFQKEKVEIGAETVNEQIAVKDFLVPPARVGVEFGQTINTGNFESLRIAVTVSVPCYTEELAEAYDHVVAFAKDRLAKEREPAVKWAKKKSSENLF